MNLVLKFEIDNWIKKFLQGKKDKNFFNTQLILCPMVISLEKFVDELKTKFISIGAQDSFWERKGSYTGGISATAIKSLGGEYLIVGHSERKKYFRETDDIIALKIKNAVGVGLNTILCVGETLVEKKQDLTNQILNKQLDIYLKDFSQGQLNRLLICYEPVWAISSNNPQKLSNADEIMMAKLIIKKFLVNKFGVRLAEKVKILYGGSVDQRNVESICFESRMDGILVGKASLLPNELLTIIEKIEEQI